MIGPAAWLHVHVGWLPQRQRQHDEPQAFLNTALYVAISSHGLARQRCAVVLTGDLDVGAYGNSWQTLFGEM